MKRLALIGLLALAACGARVPEGYRDVTRPIAAAALFDYGQFQGDWRAVALYPGTCAGLDLAFAGQTASATCQDANGGTLWTRSGAAGVAGPGRLALSLGEDMPADLRVIWIAHDYETAVIGTVDGSAGWILSRDGTISADRMAAAREMLDFNGYDVTRLVAAV